MPEDLHAGSSMAGISNHAGMNGVGGTVPSSLGGAAGMPPAGDENAGGTESAGDAGAGGTAQTVEDCDPTLIPHLDGPPAINTQRQVDASVAGDWNHDGRLDLAVSNSDGSVTVLLGRGDGSFVSSVHYVSGLEALVTRPSVTSIATSDLDANGSLDLVIAMREGHWVSVLLGASNGTFSAGKTYEMEDGPYAIALGDFDEDGATDIVAGCFSGAVSLLRGRGDGTFANRLVTEVSDEPRSMVAADLNHDGHLDVVTLGYWELAVLLGNGRGGFGRAQSYPTATTNSNVSLADFDADGNVDLALTITCNMSAFSQTGVEILIGHGDGTFARTGSYDTSAACLDRILLGDLNGDGSSDVLTSPSRTLLGMGNGTFAEETGPSSASGGYSLSIGDWNGDGKVDLATGSDQTVTVHLGNGDGTFGTSAVYATAVAPGALVIADLDRNGAPDIASATFDSRSSGDPDASKVSVLLGVGDGTFFDHIDYRSVPPTAQPIAVDLNGDGAQDLVTRNGSSTIGVLLDTAHASFAPQVTTSAGSDVVGIATGDLNGDGHPDLALSNGSPAAVILMFGNGTGTWAPEVRWKLAARPTDIALLDANGDTKLDIALAHYEGSAFSVLLGNGNGTFSPEQQYPTFDRHSRITAADLDSDGNSDLVTWSAASLSVHFGTGDGRFARRLDYLGTPSELVAADLNRDGHRDLVMVNGWPGTGFSILFGSSHGTFTCAAHYAPGLQMQGLGVADLNRDGRMDVATTTYAGVNVFVNATP